MSQSPTIIEKTLYTAVASASGGRDGRVKSDDGQVDLAVVPPKALGGSGAAGTNPEQLFAAGYAACFLRRGGGPGASQKKTHDRSRYYHSKGKYWSCRSSLWPCR